MGKVLPDYVGMQDYFWRDMFLNGQKPPIATRAMLERFPEELAESHCTSMTMIVVELEELREQISRYDMVEWNRVQSLVRTTATSGAILTNVADLDRVILDLYRSISILALEIIALSNRRGTLITASDVLTEWERQGGHSYFGD